MSVPTILFYYPVVTLLDKVKMHSAMVARMVPEGTEKYAFTSDEIVFFHSAMDKNIRQVFSMFQKLSYGITVALVLNQPSTINGTDNRYGFYINNNDAIQPNSLDIITGYIESLLIAMLLRDWWLKCGLADQYKESSFEVKNLWNGLNNMLAPLYKSTVSTGASYATSLSTIDRETGTETVTVTE